MSTFAFSYFKQTLSWKVQTSKQRFSALCDTELQVKGRRDYPVRRDFVFSVLKDTAAHNSKKKCIQGNAATLSSTLCECCLRVHRTQRF